MHESPALMAEKGSLRTEQSEEAHLTHEQKVWTKKYKENLMSFPDYYIFKMNGHGSLGTVFTLKHKYLDKEIKVFF